jgi:hypothetical protein
MSKSQTIPGPRTGASLLLRFVFPSVLGLIALSWLLLVLIASLNYPGSRFLFLLFVTAYTLMAALAFPKPRLYGYTSLAAFLFLGFCAKSVAYLGLGIALIEPTGSFDGSGHAWDSALLPAIAGSGAVIAIRSLHVIVFRRQRKAASPLGLPPPRWYSRLRMPVLAVSVGGLVTLNVLNLIFGFSQIGVSPRALPAHLSVFVEWLFVAGMAMWAATLFGWEVQLSSARFGPLLLVPFTEAVASVSTLSRAAYLFRALSYLLVAAEYPAFVRARLARHWQVLFLVLLLVGFAVHLAGASVLRVAIYPHNYRIPVAGPAPTVTPPAVSAPAQATDTRLRLAAGQLSSLVVGRWIGIEGTMAVSSHPGLSIYVFQRALRESPTVGESALYQGIAGSYRTPNGFVFLTTPGAIAVLDYSGSLPAVAVGMAFLTALLISFEIAASRLLGNAFTLSLVAVNLANAIAQMQFPYVFLVFLIEQAVAVAALALISRIIWTGKSPIHQSAQPSE